MPRLSKMKVRRLPTQSLHLLGYCAALLLIAPACKKQSAVSAERAALSIGALTKAAQEDVAEVRTGLPQGVKWLLPIFTTGKPAADDPHAARSALETARNKVQDLRIAKGTFFAVTDAMGVVIRDDDEQDTLAGKPLLPAFPGLAAVKTGQYVESRGSMVEIAGVRGRADGQWIAAQPVLSGSDVKGWYVTGWSWSAYAYRLERALSTNLRSALTEGEKMPLAYVYIIVDKAVYGTPISPEVNAQAIGALSPLKNASASTPVKFELEIAGREFGLAVELAPDLGKDVAIAVLRSET